MGFGLPEKNAVRNVQQTYQAALQNGYLARLQAYGVAGGMSMEEAERAIQEAKPLHRQESEVFNEILENVEDRKKKLTAQKKQAVSTGENNVKEASPASNEVPPKGDA